MWNPQVALYSKEIQEGATYFLEKTGKRRSCIKDIIVNGPMADWYARKVANPNHKTLLREFYQVALKKKIYRTLDKLHLD